MQGMLKFTLTVIIVTAKKITRPERLKILHSLYELLGKFEVQSDPTLYSMG